jgi:hypothetical protein
MDIRGLSNTLGIFFECFMGIQIIIINFMNFLLKHWIISFFNRF